MGRILGIHKRTAKKAGGESEARLPVDEEWTKISTVSPLPLSFPMVLTSKKQSSLQNQTPNFSLMEDEGFLQKSFHLKATGS